MGKAVMVLCMVLFMSLSPPLSIAQTKPHRTPVPASPPPVVDDLAVARNATDTFLKGIKIADLPECKEMLRGVQWITGELEVGLYERPTIIQDTTIFEKLFDADIPGAQGYKRLLVVTAVSKAGTPMLVRYLMIAYKDQHTRQWKVLFTGTGVRLDIDEMITANGPENGLQSATSSEQFRYGYYGYWLLMAGRIKEAKQALITSLSAKTTYTGPFDRKPMEDDNNTTHSQLLMDRSLLSVIDSVTGDNAVVVDHP